MGKNVAVFVDVANIFYAAKAAGVDVDYVSLLRHASEGRDLVRAYAYTGLDPENENQRNFHSFLSRHGYRVVSKDIRKYGDGKVKANLDIELVVDMMKTARNLDVAIVVSGDGDFAPAIRAVQEMGVRVEVVSFRGNTSSDLMDVADLFTDITRVAQSDRSPVRERAADEADLSMTAVPEKQSEGTGRGRRRTRRVEEKVEEPKRAAATRRRAPAAAAAEEAPAAVGGRGRGRARAGVEEIIAPALGGAGLVALPGEKLSKAARVAEIAAPASVELAEPEEELGERPGEEVGEAGEAHRRRRRRRGGRGRGRGHGAQEGVEVVEVVESAPAERVIDVEEEEIGELPARPASRNAIFGSVWDSQLGMTGVPARADADAETLEDLEGEPEIPEYLIAERRQGASYGRGSRGTGAPRGGRAGSYSAAVDRERYGRGGARPSQPFGAPQTDRGGVPRFERAGAPRQDRGGGQRFDRPGAPRPERGGPPRAERGGSSEPFSDVPPELEAMLRAQLAGKLGAGGGARQDAGRDREARPAASEVRPAASAAAAEQVSEAATPGARARGRGRKPTGAPVAAPAVPAAPPEAISAPKADAKPAPAGRATGRGRKPAAAPTAAATGATNAAAPDAASGPKAAPEGAPVTRVVGRGRKPAAAPTAAVPGAAASPSEPAAKAPAGGRGRGRKPAGGVETATETPVTAPADAKARRAPRSRKAAEPAG